MKIPKAALVALLAPLLVILATAGPASAHESSDGSIIVLVDDQVIVTAPVAFAEVGYTDTSGDGLLDDDELVEQRSTVAAVLMTMARDNAELTIDGDAVEFVGAGVPGLSHVDQPEGSEGSEYVVLALTTDSLIADSADAGAADTDSAASGLEVSNVELDWTFTSPSSTVVLAQPGDATIGELGDEGTATFSLDTWSAAVSFFDLGIEHIQYGPDHLLFLLVLTLAAVGATVSTETTWRVVKLVTAFTIGHGISLGFAYFDVVSVPAAIVEPAIALSIVVAAVLAIRGHAAETRPWLAALVGIVHGLGFASNLDSLGVATSQQVTALAAFNLGIDVAQTVVVLMVVGALWLSTQILAERAVWVRMAGATGAALIGLTWTATRLTELPTG